MATIPTKVFDKVVLSQDGANFAIVDGEYYWRANAGDTSARTFATLAEAEANWLPIMRTRRDAKYVAQQAEADEGKRKEAERAALAALVRTHGAHCYVRFGKLPAGGRSRDYRANRLEAGVCVYDAYTCDGAIYVDFENVDAVSGLFIKAGGDAHIVEGERIGTCSDGSPVLRNCTATATDKPINSIY